MEELKLVLESMEALGEDGKEAFVWWLIAKYGTNGILGAASILLVAYISSQMYKFNCRDRGIDP